LSFQNDSVDFGKIEERENDNQEDITQIKVSAKQSINKKDKKQQGLESNKDNGISLPIKLLISGGAVIVILGLVGVIW
jgi:hypothetical protein